jgi:hypothetical protein
MAGYELPMKILLFLRVMWKKNKTLIVLVVVALLIKSFAFFPDAVERYYAHGIYPVTAALQRILFGWIPISIGDLFYALAIIYLLYKLIQLLKGLFRKQLTRQYWRSAGRRTVLVILWIYVTFNALWGLNYNRKGIASELELDVQPYGQQDLLAVMNTLVERLHVLDSTGRVDRDRLKRKRNLFNGAAEAYDSLSQYQPGISYTFKSVKPSLYSYLGNYLGFTGYYNPWSGEAQVNTTVPVFVRPFTTCHEIGHQLGYAKENEANFAGYLSAKSSGDPAFRYSVYFDLYSYSWYYLYRQDSVLAKQMSAQLPIGVKKDYRELKEFLRRHRNPVELVIDKLYGEYLKANNQPSGKLSYNEVIAWLIAYYKKYGKEAI